MRKNLHFIILGLLLPPLLSFGQSVPGYLGKRFSIEYNAFLFPSLVNPNSSRFNPRGEFKLKTRGISINLQHNLIAQWCVSKRVSIVGSINYVNTNYLPSLSPGFNLILTEYPSMKARGFEVGLRLFNQHIAPLDHFMEFHMGFTRVSNDDYSYSYQDGSYPVEHFTISGGSMIRPSFGIAIGANRIIKDRILISYGLNSNFYTGGFGYQVVLTTDETKEELFYASGNQEYNQKTLTKMAAGRYAVQSVINIRLGIGIIL